MAHEKYEIPAFIDKIYRLIYYVSQNEFFTLFNLFFFVIFDKLIQPR
jgi:hypothetical protein